MPAADSTYWPMGRANDLAPRNGMFGPFVALIARKAIPTLLHPEKPLNGHRNARRNEFMPRYFATNERGFERDRVDLSGSTFHASKQQLPPLPILPFIRIYSYSPRSCLAVSVWHSRWTKRTLRCRTLRKGASPRRRASLLAGRSFTVRTGRGRLPPRQPQRGEGFRRHWIRRRSQMPIGRMAVHRLLGSRTRTAIH